MSCGCQLHRMKSFLAAAIGWHSRPAMNGLGMCAAHALGSTLVEMSVGAAGLCALSSGSTRIALMPNLPMPLGGGVAVGGGVPTMTRRALPYLPLPLGGEVPGVPAGGGAPEPHVTENAARLE